MALLDVTRLLAAAALVAVFMLDLAAAADLRGCLMERCGYFDVIVCSSIILSPP